MTTHSTQTTSAHNNTTAQITLHRSATTRPTNHAEQITTTSKQLTLKKFAGKIKKHKTLLDNVRKVGHNKDAATNKPRTSWETGKQ